MFTNRERSYFDYGATAPMRAEVLDAYVRALRETVGNPASQHSDGQNSRDLLELARETIARSFGVTPAEIVFTAGGTEAINLALKGFYWQRNSAGERPIILVAEGEHHATVDTVEWLATSQGAELVWLPLDAAGVLHPEVLERAILEHEAAKIAVITVVLVNNEIGTVQPAQQLQNIADKHGIPLHFDAVAALGQFPLKNVLKTACFSVSAHKIGGPVACGALVLRRKYTPVPLLHGGTQQRSRSGTQDAPAAIAFAKAIEIVDRDMCNSQKRMSQIQQLILQRIRKLDSGAVLRGSEPVLWRDYTVDGCAQLPARAFGNLHFTFAGCQGDSLLFLLDQHGVSVSTGSACTAGVVAISHVCKAIGLPDEVAIGALRITFSADTSDADVLRLLRALPDSIAAARRAGLSSIETK
ncbi:cysteine desulfurase [Canibacter sp. lx-45]|uniref:cysteine desulfurase family protein n=1 Tax=Canibacter zhuwentaonis TaxID=2837491 RepID=UPI001BDCC17E|nr:cysteine desulfurase family protein [Canibacter zhuwentaonis]MBT1034844.1 cysteine desulfurase [Canibacter zhuwentaonis]